MNTTYLSIIIPCFNEKKTIIKVINQIKKLKKIKKQIILIDDGSYDGTREIINKKLYKKVNKVIYHKKNMGKGAAIISSLRYIKGNLIIIQDADLEYDPKDYYKLIKPFSKKNTMVVYGSRVLGRKRSINYVNIKDFPKNFRIFGNFILTKMSNLINGQSLSDVHTCYKIFRKEIFFKLKLKEKGFSFCPEVTTKLAKLSYQIKEVPINYNGREVKDGKKIRFKDAITALKTILKYKYLY
tara:strand:+ start:3207 stop:3926 length:720 start_codon:yes stop_codon:yes gene_type:complete